MTNGILKISIFNAYFLNDWLCINTHTLAFSALHDFLLFDTCFKVHFELPLRVAIIKFKIEKHHVKNDVHVGTALKGNTAI